jgi:hypothetical protein
MPEVTPLSRSAPRGYNISDCALQDVLFGLPPADETPDGPTRTWIYQEGSADDVGCFEPMLSPDPQFGGRLEAKLDFIRIETHAGPVTLRRAKPFSADGNWVVKEF